ncbi:MAG: CBS domain-containing protein [bacterium]
MIVRNWMRKDPVSIHSDALVSEAQELIQRHGLRYVPVVDNGVLRGVLRRRDLYEAATYVTSRQNVYELRYFNERLKVKDLMIRKPKAISADEPVEEAMRKGAELGISFFPVVEAGKLVGTVSYEEIFETFAQVLGVRQEWVGITLRDVPMGPSTLREISQIVEQTQAVLRSIFTLNQKEGTGVKVVLRVETQRPQELIQSLRQAGYRIMEIEQASCPEGEGV